MYPNHGRPVLNNTEKELSKSPEGLLILLARAFGWGEKLAGGAEFFFCCDCGEEVVPEEDMSFSCGSCEYESVIDHCLLCKEYGSKRP